MAIGVASLVVLCVAGATDTRAAKSCVNSECRSAAANVIQQEYNSVSSVSQPRLSKADGKKTPAWQIAPDNNSMSLASALSEEQIRDVIAYTKEARSQAGMSGGSFYGEKEREASIWWVKDSEAFVRRLKKRLMPLVRTGVRLMPAWTFMADVKELEFESGNIQIALYRGDAHKPGKFTWHVDIDFASRSAEAGARLLTAIVQLSNPDAYEGGSLQVGKHVSSRERGSLTILPSYAAHQVSEITSGSRYSLVCWFHQRGGGANNPVSANVAFAALQHYQALRSDPSPAVVDDIDLRPNVSLFEGNLLNAGGMAKNAESAFKAGLSLKPSNAALVNGLGAALGQQGHHTRALKYFKRASRLAPTNSAYQTNVKTSQSISSVH